MLLGWKKVDWKGRAGFLSWIPKLKKAERTCNARTQVKMLFENSKPGRRKEYNEGTVRY